MKATRPSASGNQKKESLREKWRKYEVRLSKIVGSIALIRNGDYPGIEARKHFKMGGKDHRKITYGERFFMVLFLVRTYVDWGYLIRKIKIIKARGEGEVRDAESQLIELYVFYRFMALLIVLFVPWSDFLPWAYYLTRLIAVLVSWEILGLLVLPLRILFVDRYAYDKTGEVLPDHYWTPVSYNRSLLLLLVNYFEMVIGFAYMYANFDIVCRRGCENAISVLDALYFSVVTITTLGYGDLRPRGPWGKLFASTEPMFGIILLVLILGLFLVEIGKQKEQ